MNWKRILTSLCCLLVVCCLIVNISPIKAKALTFEAVLIGVSAVTVVSSILIGLGIMPGIDISIFGSLTDECATFLTTAGYAVDGLISVLTLTDAKYRYAVDEELITAVRDWIFAEEIVTSTEVPEGYALYNGVLMPEIFPDFSNLPYRVLCYEPDTDAYYCFATNCSVTYLSFAGYGLAFCFTPVEVSGSSASFYQRKLVDNSWVYFNSNGKFSSAFGLGTKNSSTDYSDLIWIWSNCDVVDEVNGGTFLATDPVYAADEVTSSYDVTLGEVATVDEVITVGYETWAENVTYYDGTSSGSDESDDAKTIPYLPIGLGQTLTETQTLTQEDVWAGTSTYEDATTDTDTEPITGTFADTAVGTFISSLVDALLSPLEWLANLLLSGIKDIFVPLEDFITAKVIALRERFGFADSIITTFEMFTSSLFPDSTSPPVLYLDLSAASGSYYLGGKVVFIDLGFYAPYKATGDALLSAFLWLVFIWRVGVRLPSIIRGAGGVVDFAHNAISDKDYEYRR